MSPNGFLNALANQPLEDWTRVDTGGIHAETAHLQFFFHRGPDCEFVKELLPRTGHFCRRQLLLSSPESGWVRTQLATYDEQRVYFEAVALLPKEELGHVTQEVKIQDCTMDLDRDYEEEHYGAVDWTNTSREEEQEEECIRKGHKQYRIPHNDLWVREAPTSLLLRTVDSNFEDRSGDEEEDEAGKGKGTSEEESSEVDYSSGEEEFEFGLFLETSNLEEEESSD